jgi:hypothetical protein
LFPWRAGATIFRTSAAEKAAMSPEGLTARQQKYRAALVANLETRTGRPLKAWLAIARSCPEHAPRARLRWFRQSHGLGQNSAMYVLGEFDRARGKAAAAPRQLRARLWCEPGMLAILAALERRTSRLPGVISGQRKGYTAWSRSYAFAAARPQRGQVRLGLALTPTASPRLQRAQREGWSERLKSTLLLTKPGDVDQAVAALLRAAWEKS